MRLYKNPEKLSLPDYCATHLLYDRLNAQLIFICFQLILEPYSLTSMVEGAEKSDSAISKQDNLDSLYEYNQF
jgi:hypothetical protein